MTQQLMNIFVSFKTKDIAYSVIAMLKESNYLNETELQFINDYSLILGSISNAPSKDLLIQKFPNYGFEQCVEIPDSILLENVELFLAEKRKSALSTNLLKIITKVQTEGITDEVRESLLELTVDKNIDTKEIVDITDVIQEKYNEDHAKGGILTGIAPIDESTGGIFPGTLTTIMGYTGAYKTLSAINITYNAINSGKNVCYLSLEVPSTHLVYDILSRHSNNSKFSKAIGHFDMKKHKLSEEDEKYVFEEILPDYNSIEGKALFLDESSIGTYTRLGLERLFRDAEDLFMKKTGKGIDLLIIDHAQLLKFNESGFGIKDPYQIVNFYTSFFRQQTLNFLNTGRAISTIILSQASREGYKNAMKHQGQYDLTALAEANELERASQNVIALYLDESLKNSKQVKVQVLKARDGATMPEPSAIFADPEYYIIGSDIVANPISMETLNTDDLFNIEGSNFTFDSSLLND